MVQEKLRLAFLVTLEREGIGAEFGELGLDGLEREGQGVNLTQRGGR